MNKQIRDSKRKAATVWTPWGEQRLGQEDGRHSRFRRRLETRRKESSRKPGPAKADASD
jgi:hypothetical protein